LAEGNEFILQGFHPIVVGEIYDGGAVGRFEGCWQRRYSGRRLGAIDRSAIRKVFKVHVENAGGEIEGREVYKIILINIYCYSAEPGFDRCGAG
jgi:hypothetical protein